VALWLGNWCLGAVQLLPSLTLRAWYLFESLMQLGFANPLFSRDVY